MRLWELEGGDGNDVGLGFVGGQGPAAAGPAAAIRDRHRDADGIAEAEAQAAALADFGDSDTEDDAAPQQPQQANQQQGMNGGDVVVEREGPLVLRLMGNPQGNGPPAVPEPPRAAPAVRGYQRGGGPAAARGRGRGRGGGGGGPARGGQQGGGRGAGRGRRGAHNPQQRQHHHQAQQQQQRNAAGGGGAGVGAAVPDHHEGADNENIGLDAIQEAWVRNFVRMALIDAEDEVEGDSDDGDDDEFFAIR
jgi:E3 ubiquitin-protein ligase RNF14